MTTTRRSPPSAATALLSTTPFILCFGVLFISALSAAESLDAEDSTMRFSFNEDTKPESFFSRMKEWYNVMNGKKPKMQKMIEEMLFEESMHVADTTTDCKEGEIRTGTNIYSKDGSTVFEGDYKIEQGRFIAVNGVTLWIETRDTFDGTYYESSSEPKQGVYTFGADPSVSFTGTWFDGAGKREGIINWQNDFVSFEGEFHELSDQPKNGLYSFADGSTFEGVFTEAGKKLEGLQTFANGDTFVGSYHRNGNPLKGVYTEKLSGAIYQGSFKENGDRNDDDDSVFTEGSNGEECTCSFEDTPLFSFTGFIGAANNTIQGRYGDGKDSFEGTFYADTNTPHKGLLTLANGDTFEGEFSADGKKLRGFMRIAASQDTFEGTFVNDVHYEGTYTFGSSSSHSSNERFTGTFTPDGVIEKGKFVYSNGDSFDGTYYKMEDGYRRKSGTYRNTEGQTFIVDFARDGSIIGEGVYSSVAGVFRGTFHPGGAQPKLGKMSFDGDTGVFEGEFREDGSMKEGMIRLAEGVAFEGTFQENKRRDVPKVGVLKYGNSDGGVFKGTFDSFGEPQSGVCIRNDGISEHKGPCQEQNNDGSQTSPLRHLMFMFTQLAAS